jgi:hypothetical protein
MLTLYNLRQFLHDEPLAPLNAATPFAVIFLVIALVIATTFGGHPLKYEIKMVS